MAKCIKFFSGYNSHGKTVDVALSSDNVWFSRSYAFNGYQVAPTKWRQMEKAPTHPNGYTNAYTSEYTEYSQQEKEKLLSWGFTTLELVEGYTKARLPNVVTC
jgi:hypothetical protein